jgi:hypothetical protein
MTRNPPQTGRGVLLTMEENLDSLLPRYIYTQTKNIVVACNKI